jgi:hypothetical protein
MRMFRKSEEGAEKKVEEISPSQPQEPLESLENMEREATIPATTKTRAEETTAPKRKGKKKPAISDEEVAARTVIARANARTIVKTVEGAKKIAAEQILGMDWSNAAITSDEELEVTSILTRYLESVGFDLSNPTATLAMLILAEARITFRQYTQLRDAQKEQEKAEQKVN